MNWLLAQLQPLQPPLMVEQGGRYQVYRDLIALVGMIFMSIMTYLTLRMNNKQAMLVRETTKLNANQEVVAEKVSTVAEKVEIATQHQVEREASTDTKFENLAAVAKSSHTFLNSEKEMFLRKFADIAIRLAESAPTSENMKAAKDAQDDYDTHRRAQGIVDNQAGTESQKKGNG